MKICILSPRLPWPEIGGDYIRINRVAQYLKANGHTVLLIAMYDKYNDTSKIESFYERIVLVKRRLLYSLFFSFVYFIRRKPIQMGYYYSPEYLKAFKKVIQKEKPDRYICWLSRMTPYIDKLDLEKNTILEMSDALSKTYTLSADSSAAPIKKFLYNLERKPIYEEEQRAIKTYPKVVLVSKPDVDYLQKEAGTKIGALSHHSVGVDVYSYSSRSYDNNKICFVGNMRTLQNQDAALRFVNDIFPIILSEIPNVKFYIVGAEPTQSILNLQNNKNVFVTGFVDDLMGFISDSCISVAPVEVAAGIQNKVLMAMGAGIPVVMSTLISHAIPQLEDGNNCFICDDNHSFAKRCIDIINNKTLRQELSENGARMIELFYSWRTTLAGYELFPDEMIS